MGKKNHDEHDISKAVKIAEKVWWVGHYLENDSFQCHTYLIENGENSVLLDPGSKLTFPETFKKIEQVIPFSNIKYFICHHQDPDITGALFLIDQLVSRDDAVIVSHWRAIALLKHYGLKMPMICVEENDWQLKDSGLELNFIFTPYLHFPGAFCSYFEKEQILFSSDIFGGFTDDWKLFAQSEDYYESMKPFHEHYMPSREILFNTMVKFEKLKLKMIAPQHGSIIPERLTGFMIERLKNTDCGLYMMSQTSTDIKKLSNLNKLLHDFMQTLVLNRDFSTIASRLVVQIGEVIPLTDIHFISMAGKDKLLLLEQSSRFIGHELKKKSEYSGLLDIDMKQWKERTGDWYKYEPGSNILLVPLFSSETKRTNGIAFLHLEKTIEPDDETVSILKSISIPLSVALEKEIIQRMMDMQRQSFYEQAIRDPLTGLYTRIYLNEAVKRLFALDDRSAKTSIFVLMLDIDHFKSVNDTFGHAAGDIVLKKTAQTILGSTRSGDVQVRMGGEEFAVFLVAESIGTAQELAERIRKNIEQMELPEEFKGRKVTISGGLACRQDNENSDEVLKRADSALYKAKNSGRNQIICA